jgi:hypothetical protein
MDGLRHGTLWSGAVGPRPGGLWRAKVWHGETRFGMARLAVARHGVTRLGRARSVVVRQGMQGLGKARRDLIRCGRAGQVQAQARQWPWHGGLRNGWARWCSPRHGEVRRGTRRGWMWQCWPGAWLGSVGCGLVFVTVCPLRVFARWLVSVMSGSSLARRT